jgi:phosphohistidine phosphatase
LGTRRLILLRHGQAEPEAPGIDDFDRVLTGRGQREAESMGRLLVARGLVPDCLLASPAERTRATVTRVADGCGLDPRSIVWLPELYRAGPEALWSVLAARDPSRLCVLICGHNPTLSQLASRLGKPARRRDLPTAGLATGVWDAADWSAVVPGDAQHCTFAAPGDSAA